MIGYYALLYFAFSSVFAVWLYYDTLKDYKFRSAAKQIALLAYVWPLVLLLVMYVAIHVRIQERKRNDSYLRNR